MKRFLLFVLPVVATLSVNAQPFVPENNDKPVKLSDAIADYRASMASRPLVNTSKSSAKKEGKRPPGERGDYHYQRWLWYWQQHTDENGYLVSPAKTFQEWQRYEQQAAKSQAKTTADLSDWKFQGPLNTFSGYGGIGRVNAVEFHPTNPNTYWVGSAGGGLWKTVNNGNSWVALTDKLPSLSVSDIDVNPKNPNVLYLCTGDRDARDHFSIGVLKSTNGGTTWNTTGITWNESQMRLANCLLVNPVDTNSLTLATSDGIYRSFNGGTSWQSVLAGNFKQVLYHPLDTNIVYATRFQANGVGTPAQIFRSSNGGRTWIQVTNLSNDAWRITLAVTPANPGVVKAVVASSSFSRYRGLYGVLSSTDTGKSFTTVFDDGGCFQNILASDVTGQNCQGQGNYDLAIAIDPTDDDIVYIGGVNTWRSANGGYSWDIVNQWWEFLTTIATVHADKHWLTFHPLVPQRLFECNDGGIYYSDNPESQTAWRDVSAGLGITQFYRNAVVDAASYVLGGSQDNGSKMLSGGAWTDESGGDGMDCQIDPVDTTIYYTGVQYGVIYRCNVGSPWSREEISDNIPGQPTGAWITPYLVSPHNNFELFAGYDEVYYSPDQGDSWTAISNISLPAGRNLLRLAMTAASNKTIYAVPENSNEVYYTHSFPASSSFSKLTAPFAGMISDIKVNPKNKDHFWVTFSGYNSPKVAEYKSGTWKVINSGLPNVPALCFEVDSSNGILYVGTDLGVFYLDTTSTQWQSYNTNLPKVHITDLGINYKSGELWAATYGRGMWKSAKQEYSNDVHVIPFAPDAVSLAPNPSKGQFVVTGTSAFAGTQVSIRLVDPVGRTIWAGKGAFDNNSRLEVATQNIPAGNYIFEVSNSKLVMARKKIIIN
jgi:hypothetical protein